MRKILLKTIIIYRKISSYKNILLSQFFTINNTKNLSGTCRFNPTCSEYMYLSIKKYGIFKGVLFGIKRIIKCHPWSPGGYDPISE